MCQRNVGWKYQKRPGVDALLASLFDYYEIVVFTSEAAMVSSYLLKFCNEKLCTYVDWEFYCNSLGPKSIYHV